MKSNYKRLGDYIRPVDERNIEDKRFELLGVSVEKRFIKSIANTVGTDWKGYKKIRRGQFCYISDTSRRGDKIGVALLKEQNIALVSQAYTVFEIVKLNDLLPEYLELWYKRTEFDRYARYHSHGSVREIFDWDAMCDVMLPVPSLAEQQKIVDAYNVIKNRIALKRKINENLEANALAVFKREFPLDTAKTGRLSELVEFRNGSSRPNEQGTTPVYGGNGILAYVNHSNARNVVIIGRVGAYCGSLYLELGDCWISDNAIYAKSKISSDEFFDFFLLKNLSISGHQEGTGQPLLTQTILNSIEIAIPDADTVKNFNSLVKPLLTQMVTNKKELDTLSNLAAMFLSRIAS